MSRSTGIVYVPALKAKGGEFGALASLSTKSRSRILPLLDVLPAPMDFKTKSSKKPLDKHLDDVGAKVTKCWGTTQELLIDLFDIPLSERTKSGGHPLSHLFSNLSSRGVRAIPVIGLERDAEYQAAVRSVVVQSQGAVAIRLLVEDIALPSKTTLPISNLLTRIGAKAERSHLLLDFRGLGEDDVAVATTRALACVRTLSRHAKWKHIVTLGSGMPDSLSSIVRTHSQAEIRRVELDLWEGVEAGLKELQPIFGDYGVVNPEFMEPKDPRTMKPSAKIRYTLERNWLVVKGGSFKDDPEQLRSMAAYVQEQTGYCGQSFSWGDDYIAGCRTRQGVGNLETWIRVDTSHHIEFVSRQIASRLAA